MLARSLFVMNLRMKSPIIPSCMTYQLRLIVLKMYANIQVYLTMKELIFLLVLSRIAFSTAFPHYRRIMLLLVVGLSSVLRTERVTFFL